MTDYKKMYTIVKSIYKSENDGKITICHIQ